MIFSRIILIFSSYFSLSLKKFVVYRINIFNHIVTLIIPIAINIFLWDSIISNNRIDYNLSQMIMYLVYANLIFTFTCINADNELEDNIKSLSLGQKLLKPVNFIIDIMLKNFLDGLCKLFVVLIPLASITIFFFEISFNIGNIPLFFLTLFIAFLLNSCMALIIGFFSFWLTEIWGVSAIRNILAGLLSGTMFPFSIFSYDIQRMFLLTPFPYVTYIPAKIASDLSFNLEIIINGLAISVTWLFVLSLFSLFLYKRGIKRYTANLA